MILYNTIAESNTFIVLEKYIKQWQVAESYQSEGTQATLTDLFDEEAGSELPFVGCGHAALSSEV